MPALTQIPVWKSIYYPLKNGGIPLQKMNKLLYQNGSSAKVYAGGVYPMIVTADPDFIQYVLQRNPKKYLKTSKHFAKVQQFLGRGLLTSEGEYWFKQRRKIQPCFHKKRLMNLVSLLDQVTDTFLQELDSNLVASTEMDICKKMQEVTCQVIAKAIFSTDLQKEESQRANKTISELQNFIIKMLRQPYLNWWFKLSGELKKQEQLRDEWNAVIQSYIQNRRASKKQYDDFLQMLLEIRYEDGTGMTDEQLVDEINILFIAGHETSSTALSWTLYLLNQHPDALEKVREEAKQVLTDGPITFEQLAQLQYNQQVLEESMRLYPPLWGTNRIAIEDDEFNGIQIKKGTTIAIYTYGVHHSPEHWEDPESFNPQRFDKDQKKGRHKNAFMPFGGGRRMCIGQHFGMMEMKMILAKMVQRYDMELVPNQAIKPIASMNLQAQNGIHLRLTKRAIPASIPGPSKAKCPFGYDQLVPEPQDAEGAQDAYAELMKGCPFHQG